MSASISLEKQGINIDKIAFKERLLAYFLANDAFRKVWTVIGSWRLQRDYLKRREHYSALVTQKGLIYSEPEIVRDIRRFIADQGLRITKKKVGEVHTFAFFPNLGWHKHLLPDLRELGPVTWFDYEGQGFRLSDFLRADDYGIRKRSEMNASVIPALLEAHKERPVDWVFVYANGCEIQKKTVQRIGKELSIPTVNMCLDDKQSWKHKWMGDHFGGQIDIAAAFTLSWTSARVATEWYMGENARPIYLPEGFDQAAYFPQGVPKDIPVSFIGKAYGYRKSVISELKRFKIPIQAFGADWSENSFAQDVPLVFNRSRINLGMGGIGYSERLTNVKGRDFEIPGTGGGMYLTSFNPDLSLHFNIGREIVCYRNFEEMVELIRYYLGHPDEAEEIAKNALIRSQKEHRWRHRFQKILNILGILEET